MLNNMYLVTTESISMLLGKKLNGKHFFCNINQKYIYNRQSHVLAIFGYKIIKTLEEKIIKILKR